MVGRPMLALAAVCFLAPCDRALAAQQYEPPSLRAARLSDGAAPLKVDGLLDDAAWAEAPVATGFRQREPSSGAPATETTEVRVVYDAETLYIGILARDAAPEGPIARILQRDRVMEPDEFSPLPRFAGDDAVAILLDPFHDHRNAVVFATNPNGAEFEALITDEGREFNIDWRTIWTVAARRTPEGWSAEFAIPFRSLRYPSADDDRPWGFNVYRVIRRKHEEVLWSAWSRENEGFHRVSRAGHLLGLAALPRAGLNVEIKPFLLGGTTQEREGTGLRTEPELDAGVDLKWEVAPGLLLDVTANTDFAQVEADDEQVNLTRFDLFFPEKRDFFLENAGVFEFGWRSFFEPPPFLLFFSRRIGIVEEQVVPVLGGVRLTGRVGRQTLGLLDVVTDDVVLEDGTPEPATNVAVARVQRDVGGAGYVGALLADRRSSAAWNTVGGIDASFWLARSINVQTFAAATAASGDGGEGAAYRLGLDYAGDRFGLTAGHLFVSPDATAEMGFVTRTDIRQTDLLGRITPRPSVLGLRKIDVYAFSQLITRTDGALQDWQVGPAIVPEWNSGESVNVFVIRGFTRLDEGFALREHEDPAIEVFVPAGDYHLWQAGWLVSTSRSRPVVFSSFTMLQWTFGGHVHSMSGNLDLSPSANLGVRLGYAHNIVRVPDGAFTARIGSLRLSYAASTRVIANALLQYNSLDNALSANVRVNVIHRPGSDLYIVFNERRGSPQSLWDVDSRTAVVKLTYLVRF